MKTQQTVKYGAVRAAPIGLASLASRICAGAVALMLLTSTVSAGKGKTYTLSPPPGSDFPSASGSVTAQVSGPYWGVTPWSGSRYKYYLCSLGAEILGLAPNTGYYFCLSGSWTGTGNWFVTDGNGNASLGYAVTLASPGMAPAAYSVVAYPTDVVELSSK